MFYACKIYREKVWAQFHDSCVHKRNGLLLSSGAFLSSGGSILLKFLLETRLQSESFDTLDDLLGFRVQKL